MSLLQTPTPTQQGIHIPFFLATALWSQPHRNRQAHPTVSSPSLPRSTPTQSRNSFVIPQMHNPALYNINLIPVILLLPRQPIPPSQCSNSPLCRWFQLRHEQISLSCSLLGINIFEEDICVIPNHLFQELSSYPESPPELTLSASSLPAHYFRICQFK